MRLIYNPDPDRRAYGRYIAAWLAVTALLLAGLAVSGHLGALIDMDNGDYKQHNTTQRGTK